MTADFCALCQSLLSPGSGPCPSCGAAREPETARNLPVGSILHHGQFAVGRVLGEGGFGITYKGAHRKLRRPVAIKELFPAVMGAMRAGTRVAVPNANRENFRRAQDNALEEARVIAGFRSPHIVDVHDMFRENGTAYIVMEYLDGPTLETRLQEAGTLSAHEARHLALNLCEALEEVHGHNLLHRDIKPANVVWLPDGRTVLIDFGAARLFAAGRTVQHTRILTVEYAAPEQYSSHARFGPYTDLFCLGATLYHAVTGTPPPGAMDRLQGRDIAFPADLETSLHAVLQRALALPIAERPQTAADFRRDLLETEAVPARNADANHPPAHSVIGSRSQVDRDAAIAYFNQGYAKAQLGQHAAAIADYDQALRLDPNDAAAYNNRGAAKADLGQYDNATADYDQALHFDPNFALAYNNRGYAKRKLRQYADAIADYDQALRLDPNDATAYNNRGIAKGELEQYADAIADYDQALRLDPSDAAAYNNRGAAKADLRQYVDAIVDYGHALRLNPNFALAYNNRGIAKVALEQYAAAIADYDQALRLDPAYAWAYRNRGYAKGELGQHTDAIADYDQALCLDPNFALAYRNRGYAKGELGQHADAIADYDQALCLDSNDVWTYNSRGIAKAALEQHAAAIADYDQALCLDPTYAWAYRNRGYAKGELEQHAAAIADYDQALRLDPNDVWAYNNRGVAKAALEQYAAAIADYDQALCLDPNNALAYNNRKRCLAQMT